MTGTEDKHLFVGAAALTALDVKYVVMSVGAVVSLHQTTGGVNAVHPAVVLTPRFRHREGRARGRLPKGEHLLLQVDLALGLPRERPRRRDMCCRL